MIFRGLFIASGLDAMGLSFIPLSSHQGVMVSAMETPIRTKVIDTKKPVGAELQSDFLEVGDVLVQIDSEVVWNKTFRSVLDKVETSQGKPHSMYFVDQLMFHNAIKRNSLLLQLPTLYHKRMMTSHQGTWWPSLKGYALFRASTDEERPAPDPTVAVEADPSNVAIGSATQLQNEGDAAFGLQRFGAAVTFYTKGIALDPTNHLLYASRSASLYKLKRINDSLRDACECIRLCPEWPMGYFRKGIALESKNDSASQRRACAAYLTGLCVNPQNVALSSALSGILSKLCTSNRTLFPSEQVVVLRDPDILSSAMRALQNRDAFSNIDKFVLLGDGTTLESMGYKLEPLFNDTYGAVVTEAPANTPRTNVRTQVSDSSIQVGDVLQLLDGKFLMAASFNEIVVELEAVSSPVVIGLARAVNVLESGAFEKLSAMPPVLTSMWISLQNAAGMCFDEEFFPQELRNTFYVYQSETGTTLSYERGHRYSGWVIGKAPIIYAAAPFHDSKTEIHGPQLGREVVDRLQWRTLPSDWEDGSGPSPEPQVFTHDSAPVVVTVKPAYRTIPIDDMLVTACEQGLVGAWEYVNAHWEDGAGFTADVKHNIQVRWKLMDHYMATKGAALRLFADKQFSKSIGVFSELLIYGLGEAKVNGFRFDNHHNRALAYYHSRAYERAISDFETCFTLQPTNQDILLQIVLIAKKSPVADQRQRLSSIADRVVDLVAENNVQLNSRLQHEIAEIRGDDPSPSKPVPEPQTESTAVRDVNPTCESDPARKDLEDALNAGVDFKKHTRNSIRGSHRRHFRWNDSLDTLTWNSTKRRPSGLNASSSAADVGTIRRTDCEAVYGCKVQSPDLQGSYDVKNDNFITLVTRERTVILEAENVSEKMKWLNLFQRWIEL